MLSDFFTFTPTLPSASRLHLALTQVADGFGCTSGCPCLTSMGSIRSSFSNTRVWCNPELRMTWVAEEGQALSSGIMVWFLRDSSALTTYIANTLQTVNHVKLGIGYWLLAVQGLDFLIAGFLSFSFEIGSNEINYQGQSQAEIVCTWIHECSVRQGALRRIWCRVAQKHHLNIVCNFLDIIYHHLSAFPFFLSVCLCVCLYIALFLSLARARSLLIITHSPTTSRWIYVYLNLIFSVKGSQV